MRPIILTFIALTGFSSFIRAQQLKSPAWRVSDFQFSMGTEVANTSPIIRPVEIANFAPGSQFIVPGQAGFYSDGWIPAWSSSLLTLQIGLHPADKVSGEVKKNRTLRLGLTAQGIKTQIYSSMMDRRFRMDTLLNSSSSSLFGYLDSVYHHDVYADYSGTAIKLEASFVYSTDPERRFSLYGGAGVNAGALINTRTDVSSTEWSTREITDSRGYLISDEWYQADELRSKEENYRNKSGWSASLFIPLGVDLRLGKKKDFWNQLHLFTEMRPSLTMLSMPETKTYVVPGIQNTAGFKVHW